jgi:precorrin-6Y C5,15-methyltransferase (decarboxylating)
MNAGATGSAPDRGAGAAAMNAGMMDPAVAASVMTVIGCDGSPLRPDAAAALAAADHVAGAPRHLDSVDVPATAERIEIKVLDDALDAIGSARGRVVVLASGDPGFFGIVRALRSRGATPTVIPAVSSVALAFARLGLDWDDALVVSAHGRDPERALAAALAHPKTAILTAPGTARELGLELAAAGRRVYVAERLGTPSERVTELITPDEPPVTFAEPNIVIAIDPQSSGDTALPGDPAPPASPASYADGALPVEAAPPVEPASSAGPASSVSVDGPRWLAGRQAPDGWALPETAFEHRNSMITKSEVRALVLARLAPAPGRAIWDIGAGSGSVAVECARFGAWVTAVEQDPEQCRRIRRNAAAHSVRLRVVEGRAPVALAGLRQPHAIFVGGGDDEVLDGAIRAGTPNQVVVTLAALERVGEVAGLLRDLDYRYDGVQLQASRLSSLPAGGHRLAAQNPVFVLWGERR